MAKNPQISLKPQDVVLLFKFASNFQNEFRYSKFSADLGIAASEVHAGVKRLSHARLIIDDEGDIMLVRKAFVEYILFGAIYSFPPVRGTVTRGIPTSYAAQPLADLINQPDELPPVWPDPNGSVQGVALFPLYPSVVSAAIKDNELYKNLALFDALRSGSAREREIAQQLIRECCS